MKIRPIRVMEGRLSLPGDKSISHRAAMIAALSRGNSYLSNFSSGRDCASTLTCLERLGVSILRDGPDIQVKGSPLRFSPPEGPLDCGNSGSTMRMLAGILAGQEFTSTLTGDDSLLGRPMERIVKPLEMMGARIFTTGGRPPMHIQGQRPLAAIHYELPVASAQVKTCVLLAGLQADGRTEVVERHGLTRDHTERMLRWFGAPVDISEDSQSHTTGVVGPAHLDGKDVKIPGDFSAAAFLIAAAALLPGSQLEINDIGLNPTRTSLLPVLQSVGARIEIMEVHEECNEPVGALRILGTELPSLEAETIVVEGTQTAALIDELPLLAVVGTQMPGGIIIRDAEELRSKETDRIAATVKNLRAMGAEVEEYQDGLAVARPSRLQGAVLDSFADHRIAMAFTVAALLAEGESEIAGSACVAISFPEFFEVLESITKQ